MNAGVEGWHKKVLDAEWASLPEPKKVAYDGKD
jgi:hypothetical protein